MALGLHDDMNQLACILTSASGLALPLGLVVAARLVTVARRDLGRIHSQRAIGVIDTRLLSLSFQRVLCAGVCASDVAIVTIVSVLTWPLLREEPFMIPPPSVNIVTRIMIIIWAGLMTLFRHCRLITACVSSSEECSHQDSSNERQARESNLGLTSRRERLRQLLGLCLIGIMSERWRLLTLRSTLLGIVSAFLVFIPFHSLVLSHNLKKYHADKDEHQNMPKMLTVTYLIFAAVFISMCSVLLAIGFVRRKIAELKSHLHTTAPDVEVPLDHSVEETPPVRHLPPVGRVNMDTAIRMSPIPSLSISGCLVLAVDLYSIWLAVAASLLHIQVSSADHVTQVRSYTALWIYSCSSCYWTYLIQAFWLRCGSAHRTELERRQGW